MVRDTLRKASKVADAPLRRTEEAVRKIAERPNIDLMDAPHLAWEFIQKGRQQAEKAKGALDAQVRKRLKEMGLRPGRRWTRSSAGSPSSRLRREAPLKAPDQPST